MMKKTKDYFDRFGSAYLIYGKDGYLLDERLKAMKAKAAELADMDFNYSSFRAVEDRAEDILTAAETMPLFSTRRFVVVREAEQLQSQELKKFEAWLAAPSEYCTLIFVSANITRKHPLFGLVGKYGEVSETKLKGQREYLQRIKIEFQKRKVQIEDQAAIYLLDFIGEDMASLLNEIDKAAFYFKGKRDVRQKDLEGFLSRNYNSDFNGFLNALDARRPSAALEYLENIVEKKSDIQRIFAVFCDRIRFLFEMKVKLSEKNYSPAELAQELRWGNSKGSIFRARKTMETVEAYSFNELEKAIKLIFESDYILKSSNVDSRIILEKTIVSVIGRGKE